MINLKKFEKFMKSGKLGRDSMELNKVKNCLSIKTKTKTFAEIENKLYSCLSKMFSS